MLKFKSKSKHITSSAARDLAKKFDQGMVIIISNSSWDHDGLIEVVKYGKTKMDEAMAISILQKGELLPFCSNPAPTKRHIKKGK